MPARRVSEGEREAAIALLREGFAAGRLSTDTLYRRLDTAFAARDEASLEGLVADVRSRAPEEWLSRRIWRLSRAVHRVRTAWRAGGLPPLVLPPDATRALRIGRSAECDLVVTDPSVSRLHAELRPGPRGWYLADLGSTNGTRVNGWRVRAPRRVRACDLVTFGAVQMSVAEG